MRKFIQIKKPNDEASNNSEFKYTYSIIYDHGKYSKVNTLFRGKWSDKSIVDHGIPKV